MAKIVQVITRPSRDYDVETAEAQVRDLDAIVEKLNSTFQEELKDEIEAFNIFVNFTSWWPFWTIFNISL